MPVSAAMRETRRRKRGRMKMDKLPLSELDFKHLLYASSVNSCGSITKAAEVLFVAPPNLSRAIGELEEKLGFPLFIRSKKGMTPTKEGQRFLEASDALMADYEKLIAGCRSTRETSFFFSCVPSSLFVNVFLGASAKLPGYRISSREYSRAEDLFQSVMKGRADAGFLIFGKSMRDRLLSYVEERGLTYHFVAESPLYLIFEQESPFYRKVQDAQESVPDLSGYRLITNVSYYEPLGIRMEKLPYPFPESAAVQKGGGRAANLDMLDAMEDGVLLGCLFHSRILKRNHLAAIPYRPSVPIYEYGYVTRAGRAPAEGWNQVMDCILRDLKEEFDRPLSEKTGRK